VVQPEAAEKGVEFLRESLRQLGIDPAQYEPLLESAVEKVYDERGLMVDQGKTREERIRERSQFFKVQAPPEN
jgi:SOS response regulatory protein OraA/RecX